MCNTKDPQDRKILLLAELVETKCEALGASQEELKNSLSETNEKLDKLTTLLEELQRNTLACPVYKDMASYEKLNFIVKHPKVSILLLLGTLALIGGFFGANVIDGIKMLMGL